MMCLDVGKLACCGYGRMCTLKKGTELNSKRTHRVLLVRHLCKVPNENERSERAQRTTNRELVTSKEATTTRE
jgi:hypothetical protein